MAQTFIGRKRIRKRFGSIADAAEMPNLIEVQKQSYDQFLMVQEPVGGRPATGLQAVFASIFPIKDFSDKAQLEFVRYDFEPPKYDVDECQQRSMTYAAPLKVKLRLITFDVNEETGSRSVRDIKEQDVYMGDIPFMTSNGTFVINGTERVIVSQCIARRASFFTTTAEKATLPASSSSPRESFRTGVRGSISNSTPRISSTPVSTGSGSCRRRRCFTRWA